MFKLIFIVLEASGRSEASVAKPNKGASLMNFKVTKAYISLRCRKTPSRGISTILGTFGDLIEVINL
jgi:hypothetical protein